MWFRLVKMLEHNLIHGGDEDDTSGVENAVAEGENEEDEYLIETR